MKCTTPPPIVKHCAQCGVEFTPAKTTQRFCSAECRNKNRYALLRKPLPSTKQCEQCGAEFTPDANKGNGHRFCCEQCQVSSYNASRYESITYTCQQCGRGQRGQRSQSAIARFAE